MADRITYITPSHTQIQNIIRRLKDDPFLTLSDPQADSGIDAIIQNLDIADRLRQVLTADQFTKSSEIPEMGSQYWNTLVNNKDLRLNQPDASQRENIQGGEVFRRVRKCHELEQLYINKHFEILESFNTLIQLLTILTNLVTLIFIIISDLVRTQCPDQLATVNVPMSIIGNMKGTVGSQVEMLNRLRQLLPRDVLRNKFSSSRTLNQNYGTGNLFDKDARGMISLRRKKRNNTTGRRQLGGANRIETAMDENEGDVILGNEDYINRLANHLDQMLLQMQQIQANLNTVIPAGRRETEFSETRFVSPRANFNTTAWNSISQGNKRLKFFDYDSINQNDIPESFRRFMSNDPDRFNAANANNFSNNATDLEVKSFLEKCYELEVFYIKKHLELANMVTTIVRVLGNIQTHYLFLLELLSLIEDKDCYKNYKLPKPLIKNIDSMLGQQMGIKRLLERFNLGLDDIETAFPGLPDSLVSSSSGSSGSSSSSSGSSDSSSLGSLGSNSTDIFNSSTNVMSLLGRANIPSSKKISSSGSNESDYMLFGAPRTGKKIARRPPMNPLPSFMRTRSNSSLRYPSYSANTGTNLENNNMKKRLDEAKAEARRKLPPKTSSAPLTLSSNNAPSSRLRLPVRLSSTVRSNSLNNKIARASKTQKKPQGQSYLGIPSQNNKLTTGELSRISGMKKSNPRKQGTSSTAKRLQKNRKVNKSLKNNKSSKNRTKKKG